MFFILISLNLISYIMCGKFLITGNYLYAFIALLISLFVSICIRTLYIKKTQRLWKLKTKNTNLISNTESILNSVEVNPTIEIKKENTHHKKSKSFYWADCFNMGDCIVVPLLFGDCSDCNGLGSGIGECGGLDYEFIKS